MDKYLTLISISGIQNYIEKAIKTKDLWHNSYVVVECMSNYIKKCDETFSKDAIEWIIPQKEEEGKQSDIPNYCLFSCRSNLDEFALRDYIYNQLLDEMYTDLPVYVCIVKWDGAKETYSQAYDKLYMRLALLKSDRANLYDRIVNSNGAKYNPMRTLDGGQVCIKYHSKNVINQETICPDCQKDLKKVKSFPSTSDIAIWHELILREDLESLEDKSRESLFGKGYVKSTLYGLVQIDIDDFGKHISGQYLKNKNELQETQRLLIQNIAEVTSSLNAYIEDIENLAAESFKPMKLKNILNIYMGGDDFLFFSPVRDIHAILIEMRRMQDNLNQKLVEAGYNHPITFSASVIIAHHESDFQSVLQLSRRKIKEVKAQYTTKGKNAICLTLKQRSGAIYTTNMKFEEETLKLIEKNVLEKNDKKIKGITFNKVHRLEEHLRNLGTVYSTYGRNRLVKDIIWGEIRRACQEASPAKNSISYDDLIQLLELNINIGYSQCVINWDDFFALLKIIENLNREEKIIEKINVSEL